MLLLLTIIDLIESDVLCLPYLKIFFFVELDITIFSFRELLKLYCYLFTTLAISLKSGILSFSRSV